MGTPTPTQPTVASTPLATGVATPLSPSPSPPDYERPTWLILLVIATVLAVAVILGIAAWQARKR
jgi:hypothetical protein